MWERLDSARKKAPPAAPCAASYWCRVRGSADTCAEGERDRTPGVEAGRRRRQMEDDAARRDDDVRAQLEQPLAQPRHLGARIRGARCPQPEFLHEDVRSGGEEHAQLIRPEATATGATNLEPVVQFLDPVFDVAARAV